MRAWHESRIVYDRLGMLLACEMYERFGTKGKRY